VLVALSARSGFARVEENPCAPDIEQALRQIGNGRRSDLTLWTNGRVPGRYYTRDVRAHFGLNNHFQGVERLRDSNFMVVSGGVIQEHQAQLFVAEMRSRPEEGDFGSNLSGKPAAAPPEDGMVERLDFDDPVHWHAGGLARIGDVVVVPLSSHGENDSRIVFYDFSTPLNPVKIPTEIVQAQGGGSVAIEKLPDGRFIVVTQIEEALQFYYSRSARLEDGFEDAVVSRRTKVKRGFHGEGIQLIRQCDGRLFYLDFDNDGPLPPLINGQDQVRLHEITGATGNRADDIVAELKSRVHLTCGGSCNFAATAGLYVGEDHRVRIYSTYFYRGVRGSQLRFAEFAQ